MVIPSTETMTLACKTMTIIRLLNLFPIEFASAVVQRNIDIGHAVDTSSFMVFIFRFLSLVQFFPSRSICFISPPALTLTLSRLTGEGTAMDAFLFADDRPANPVASLLQNAAHVYPSPSTIVEEEGRGEVARHTDFILNYLQRRKDVKHLCTNDKWGLKNGKKCPPTDYPHCARCRSAWSTRTSAVIASTIGTARGSTHGSCRPRPLSVVL